MIAKFLEMRKLKDRLIKDARYQSFYLKGELVSRINVLFLNVDDDWVKIASGDGITTIDKCTVLPSLLPLDDFEGEFAYPINKLIFDWEIFDKIVSAHEYLWKGTKGESCGLLIRFENGNALRIMEDDDSLILEVGEDTSLPKEWTLHEMI